jgi:hypothetical protein
MLSNITTDDRRSNTITIEDVNQVIVKREELDFLTSFIDDTNDKYFISVDDTNNNNNNDDADK